jgi:large subunit ribosomal protein L6
MSRIGRQPVVIRPGVEVTVVGDAVRVKGPKTTLEAAVAPHTRVEVTDGRVLIHRSSDDPPARAAHGLMRSLISNMMAGVTGGFTRTLEIVGVGYRAEVAGRELRLSLGFSHPVVVKIPEGLEVVAESPTRLTVRGADKHRVGQFSANVRRLRPPEPYKGKGIRYSDERVRRKVGKAGVGSGS